MKIHADIISNDWFWRMRFCFYIKTYTTVKKLFFFYLCEFYSKINSLFIFSTTIQVRNSPLFRERSQKVYFFSFVYFVHSLGCALHSIFELCLFLFEKTFFTPPRLVIFAVKRYIEKKSFSHLFCVYFELSMTAT